MSATVPDRNIVILVADDIPDNVELLRYDLEDLGYSVLSASSGSQAIELARRYVPDLMVLDVNMPDITGIEICKIAITDMVLKDIPIMLLSAEKSDDIIAAGLEAGAHDYIPKPYDLSVLAARVKATLRSKTKVDRLRVDNITLRDEMQRNAHLVDQLVVAKANLEQRAYYDELTGLPNRTLSYERLKHTLSSARRGQNLAAVAFVDLDGFKAVNDARGHQAGDIVLQTVARRLVDALREVDTVARIGGDEFIVILGGIDCSASAVRICKKLLAEINLPIEILEGEARVGASIGVALFPEHGESSEELVKNADIAMYDAKSYGKNTVRFYREKQSASRSGASSSMTKYLRQASHDRDFWLAYQPIIDISTGDVVTAEALIRWKHPERGPCSPKEFIPVLEETGLICSVGQWVIEKALEQLEAWSDLPSRPRSMSVNISPRQLRAANAQEAILDSFSNSLLGPEVLTLEVTEGLLVDENIVRVLEALRAEGIKIAMDDFGTGYSSLSRIEQLPLDTLKIDQSFIMKVNSDSRVAAIVETIIGLGTSLGFDRRCRGS